jgi:Rrf2 family protein
MRFTTRTEYGFVCMAYLAKHVDEGWIPLKDIARDEKYSPAYVEKILQPLCHANLVDSQQGHHGGYALAKKPSEITVKEIIDALEGGTFEVFCSPKTRAEIVCTHFCLCGIKPIWRKTKQLLDEFYGAITLDMLMKNEFEVQHMMQ